MTELINIIISIIIIISFRLVDILLLVVTKYYLSTPTCFSNLNKCNEYLG
jgi:hypothetical protein